MVQDEHPDKLPKLLDVCAKFLFQGHTEAAHIILKHLSASAALSLDKDHPLNQIYQCLAHSDYAQIEDVVMRVWECNNDVFMEKIGHWHETFLDSALEFHTRRGQTKSSLDSCILLQQALFECEQVWGKSDEKWLYYARALAWCLHYQHQHDEAERVAKHWVQTAVAKMHPDAPIWKVEGLNMLALNQKMQGNMVAAEQNLKTSVELCVEQQGWHAPNVIALMSLRGEWLRKMGRTEEATELDVWTAAVLGSPEILDL